MNHLSTFIGSAVCGALVFAIWPEMWKSYGIMGGWLAATILISIAWYLNHWVGVIENPQRRIWIDQGWAVGTAGVAWAVVRFGASTAECIPTLACCLIGGALAGVCAAAVKRTLRQRSAKDSEVQKAAVEESRKQAAVKEEVS